MSYTTLISVDELAGVVDDENTIVIDCRFALGDPAAGEAEYAAGHLPGAQYAHLDRDLSSPVTDTSGRHPLPDAGELASRFAAWGIDPTKQIVTYDNSGGAFASRLWWLARWLGLTRVAVLDGGFKAWQAAGHKIATDTPTTKSTEFSATPNDSLWLTSDQLSVALEADEVLLIDAREAQRYRGEVEPIDPVAGHVPGAANLPFKENLNATGKYLSRDELRARFVPVLSDRSPQRTVHMCGSGVTACVNLLASEHAGLTGGKLYAGSWSEWIRDDHRSVATG